MCSKLLRVTLYIYILSACRNSNSDRLCDYLKLVIFGRKPVSYSYSCHEHLAPRFLSALKCFDFNEIFYTASFREYPEIVWFDYENFSWFKLYGSSPFEILRLSKNVVMVVNYGMSITLMTLKTI